MKDIRAGDLQGAASAEFHRCIGIYPETGTRGDTGGMFLPQDFCNKQRNVLFVFRNCVFSLIKKVPLKCHAPQV